MTRKLAAFVLVVVCAVASFEAEAALRAVALPRATMRELATIELPPAPRREARHSEERRDYARHTRDRRIGREEITKARIASDVTIPAPPVVVGFATSGTIGVSPADSTGAVSKTHIMTGTNMAFAVYTRGGTKLVETSLSQFWNAGNSSLVFYDPRVVYDVQAKRWVVMAIRDAFAVMLAVSATDDPTGVWYRYQIGVEDCDFSRLALTRDTVLVSTIFGSGESSLVMSFRKSELYAGPAAPSVHEYGANGDAMPVHAPESTIEYVVMSTNAELIVRRLDTGAQRYIDAGFSWVYPFDDSAPQFGGNHLSAGYGDVQSAVMRNGWIYAVHRIGASFRTSDNNALLWWKVDPDNARPHELGIVDSPSGQFYLYPSMAVNGDGAMLISFCVLSSQTYPSAAYVYRDAAGRVSAPTVLRTGTTAVTGTDRWGDYTVVVEDPANGRDFWIGQIYATRRAWETWWANVKVPIARARAVRH